MLLCARQRGVFARGRRLDLADIEVLLGVARSGSLSAAAKRQGVAVSTVARRLAGLEAALRLRLVDRRATGAQLTPAGARLAALAAPLGDQLAVIARAAEALRAGDGLAVVRVSATEAVIADILAPALPALFAAAPGLRLQLQSQAELVSLAAGGAELAIRMSPPQGASLLAKRLPEQRVGLWASRAWLAGRDPGKVDLRTAPLLAYDDSFGRLPEMAWLDRLGLTGAIVMRTGSTRALVAATATGAGIGLVARIFIHPGDDLVELPTATPAPPRVPWLIAHRDTRRLPPVAAVHRWIVQTFRNS